MANLRLRRLKIQKFRNVVPGTELVFSDGMNVLLGRNGTGKTTLLQLIAMVTSSSFGPLVEDEFQLEYDLFLLGVVFRVSFSNRPGQSSQFRMVRKRGVSEAARTEWSFRVSLLDAEGKERQILASSPTGAIAAPELGLETAIPVRDPLRDEGPIEQAIDVLLTVVDAFETMGSEPEQWEAIAALLAFSKKASLFQHLVAQQGGRFDEGLGTFGGIVSDYGFLSVDDARQPVLLYYKEVETVYGRFVPEEVVRAAELCIKESGVGDLSLPDAKLSFLRRALDLIGGREGRMILRIQKEESTDNGGDATFGDFEFLVTMADGSVFRHDYLSYGQKRLLSFLYYAATNPEVIVADELVNGLHHEWIDACLDEIADRQSFLTSQNPLLLDYLSFDSVKDAKNTFLLCEQKHEGKRTQLVWQHMDQGSAEAFFRAYRAGLQHVSEILRTKGLW